METQSLVTVMPWTFIFTICNLMLLAAGVKHFLFKPVQNVMAKRKEHIDHQYEEASQAEQSAKELQTEYEQRLAGAKTEATEIVQSATSRAAQRSEEMMSEARAVVSALKQKAQQDIDSDRAKAAGELKNDIAGIALDLAEKVVEKELDADSHKALIDTFIQNVGDVS